MLNLEKPPLLYCIVSIDCKEYSSLVTEVRFRNGCFWKYMQTVSSNDTREPTEVLDLSLFSKLIDDVKSIQTLNESALIKNVLNMIFVKPAFWTVMEKKIAMQYV